jgi:hypothetical protein
METLRQYIILCVGGTDRYDTKPNFLDKLWCVCLKKGECKSFRTLLTRSSGVAPNIKNVNNFVLGKENRI